MQEDTLPTTLDPLVDIPSELIIELAVGIGKFDDICRNHGYSTSQIEFLRDSPVLQRRVAATESELTRDGVTHKFRSSYVSDVALKVMHQRLLDPATSTGQVIDIYKETVKTADLLPKNNQVVQQGSGFSLIINLPAVGDQPGRTIEMNRDVNNVSDAEPLPVLGTIMPDVGTMNRSLNSSLELPEDFQDE